MRYYCHYFHSTLRSWELSFLVRVTNLVVSQNTYTGISMPEPQLLILQLPFKPSSGWSCESFVRAEPCSSKAHVVWCKSPKEAKPQMSAISHSSLEEGHVHIMYLEGFWSRENLCLCLLRLSVCVTLSYITSLSFKFMKIKQYLPHLEWGRCYTGWETYPVVSVTE